MNDAWIIRFASTGATMKVAGPDAVIAGLKSGQWDAADEVRGPGAVDFTPIEEHPAFGATLAEIAKAPKNNWDAATRTVIRPTASIPRNTRAANSRETARSRDKSEGFPPVPGYSVLGRIEAGGMGVVYKAIQEEHNRVVALKFVHGGRTASERDLNRFLAEVELVAAIDHPNIVRVYDTGDASGSPYLAMEYLPGGTLSERLRALKAVKKPQETKEPPMPPKFAAELVRKLALGVQAAHDRDIVHRDLKPSNVLFDANGEPRITDFGLAKKPGSELTMTNDIMGTPAYMAPEQARGGTKFVGPAADIYSLGVILYECVTGVRPYEDPDPIMLIRKVAEQTAPPIRAHIPSLNRNLELIVEKCLLKEPTERYETATDLADDLRRWLNNEPVSVNAQDPAAKWLIRFESTGRSLPVKNPERVIAGLRAGEWEAADEVRGPGDTDWLPIEDHPAFADAVSDLNPPRLEAPDETKLDMNPLIDVALVLLIFFILTTTYSSLKRSIDVPAEPDNEKGKVAQKIRPEDLKDSAFAVSAWMDGNTVRFRIDDKVVEQGEVERAMTDQVRTTGRRQIILSVEGKVPWGAEAVIHDGAKGAGIQQIFRKKWKAGE